jgi:hypothetical protein
MAAERDETMDTHPTTAERSLAEIRLDAEYVVVGGGLAGVCSALAAAREGVATVLVQDRAMLGGNTSSEIRVWALGATSHMGNNNRWARESGIIGEILEENLYRNREGNPVMFDLLLLDLVRGEPNLTLLLNTTVDHIEKDGRRIVGLGAFNAINQTRYAITGHFFCDASGDGILGYLAGAEFRVGAEPRETYGEGLAPGDNFGQLLGHSIFFTTRRTEAPVAFVKPGFALDDITRIPRYRRLTSKSSGAGDLWWLEWGGEHDTVHDSEAIKWELWRIVWGAWDHIKNSGRFDDAANLTVDWVGLVPGKRESRRFVGDYTLTQNDLIDQIDHPDAITHGGWSIDLHPAAGVYSALDGCLQCHAKGTYTIPYRCYVSRDIDNLFLSGRIISASHVAFASTRIQLTCAQGGEVTGRAAAWCLRTGAAPRALAAPDRFAGFRRHLAFGGFHVPRHPLADPAGGARVTASSTRVLDRLAPDGRWFRLDEKLALMLPLKAGERLPELGFTLRAATEQTVRARLLVAEKPFNHTPEIDVGAAEATVAGTTDLRLAFDYRADTDRYVFVAFEVAPEVEMALSAAALPGIMTVFNSLNPRVARRSRQVDEGGYGIPEFDFWLPKRRPAQFLPAMTARPALALYAPDAVVNGVMRPERQANAWVPAADDARPWLELAWDAPQPVEEVVIVFDNDFDHAMENIHFGHPEAVTPHCVTRYRLLADGRPLVEVADNRHSVCRHVVAARPEVRRLRLEILATAGAAAAVYAVHVR